MDPLEMGRAKVRVRGIHTEDEGDLPTKDLPWANVVHPTTSAAYDGIGYGGVGITIDTTVMVYFRDPGNWQEPMIMGTLPGLFKEDGTHKLEYEEEGDISSDLGRISRNYKIDKTTVQKRKKEKLDHTIEYTYNDMQTAGCSWCVVQRDDSDVDVTKEFKEVETPYASEYPYNHVTETNSGHMIEMDDTPGAERVHIYHRSGTMIEIHPDGSLVHKIVGPKVQTIHEYIPVEGEYLRDCTEENKPNGEAESPHREQEVEGDRGKPEDGSPRPDGKDILENHTYYGGKVYTIIENSKEEIVGDGGVIQHNLGNQELVILGNHDIHVNGNETKKVTGTFSMMAGTYKREVRGNDTTSVGGNQIETICGNKVETVCGTKIETVLGGFNLNITGDININTDGVIRINGRMLYLNTPQELPLPNFPSISSLLGG